MHTITLVMELSSDDALATVVTAVQVVPDVRVGPPARTSVHQIVITIRTDDADVLDIVRELVWEFDPSATQQSVELSRAG